MQTARFQDKRYGNWLKVGLSLIYMKEGLKDFAEKQSKSLHTHIQYNLQQQGRALAGIACKHCKAQDIRVIGRKWTFRKTCPVNVCDVWIDEILKYHVNSPCPKDVSWYNTNPQIWPTDSWEVAKIFQPYGCQGHSSPCDCDAAAILTLMGDCTHFHQFLSKVSTLQDIKVIRNRTMHTNDMLVDDVAMIADINTVIQLLQDQKHLAQLMPCQEAVRKIEELRDNITDLSLNKELELKVLHQRTSAIEADVGQLKDKFKGLRDNIDTIKMENEKTKTINGEYKQKIEKMEELKMELKRLSNEIDKFTIFINTNENNIRHIKSALQENKNDTRQLIHEVENHEEKLRHHEREIQDLEISVKEHAKALQQQADAINKQAEKYDVLQQHQETVGERVKHHNSIIKQHVHTIDKQSTITKTLSARQNALADDVTQTKTDIKNLKTNLETKHGETAKRVDKLELRSSDTDFDLNKVQENLMAMFRSNYLSQSMISPFDTHDVINIEEIYTELYIIEIPKQKGTTSDAAKGTDKSSASTRNDADEQFRYRSAIFMHEFRYKEGKKVDSLKDILERESEKFNRVVIQGDAGCGKTTWCYKIVQDWVVAHDPKQTKHELSPTQLKLLEFDLLFPITLSELRDRSDFENTLRTHVLGFDSNLDIAGLKKHIYEHPSKVLFLLDGLDECKTISGFIDDLIEFKTLELHDTCLIITSRPWKVDNLVRRKHIHRVIEIRGFNDSSISIYISRYLQTTDIDKGQIGSKQEQILSDIKRRGIYHLVKIPLLLLLICHLWIQNKMQSTTYTGIYIGMLDLFLDRLDYKFTSSQQDNMILKERDNIVLKLSKFAWRTAVSCNPEENSLMFEESDITQYISEDDLQNCQKIGLISKSRSFITRRGKVTLSFPHRSMHEFLAAYFIANIENGFELVKSHIDSKYGVDDIFGIANILLFVCGLNSNVGISMLNFLSNRVSFYGRQLSTNFLLFCCHEIVRQNNSNTMENIQEISLSRVGILEKELLQICKTCIQRINVDLIGDILKIPDALNFKGFFRMTHLQLNSCRLDNKPVLPKQIEHILLNAVQMDDFRCWRSLLKDMSGSPTLKSLQIYNCSDDTSKKVDIYSVSSYGFPNEDHLAYICIARCNFQKTKVLLPANARFIVCRLFFCEFKKGEADLIKSLQGLEKLESLYIENCKFSNVKLPSLESLRDFVLDDPGIGQLFAKCIDSMNTYLYISDIKLSNSFKQNMFFTTPKIPPIPMKASRSVFIFGSNKQQNILLFRNFEIVDEIVSLPSLGCISTLRFENIVTSSDLIGSANSMPFLKAIEITACTIKSTSLQLPAASTVETFEMRDVILSVRSCESLFKSLAKQTHMQQCVFRNVNVDEKSLKLKYDNYSTYKDGCKVIMSDCRFGGALISCPALMTNYQLYLQSVEMTEKAWLDVFFTVQPTTLKGICIQKCFLGNIYLLGLRLPFDAVLESFIITDTVLSRGGCESICMLLTTQTGLKEVAFENIRVGSKEDIPTKSICNTNDYSPKTASFINCNFEQAVFVRPALDNITYLRVVSVNMSDSSWVQFFDHLKLPIINNIVIEKCNLEKTELSLDGIQYLTLVNINLSALKLSVVSDKISSIDITNVKMNKLKWQEFLDSMTNVKVPFRIMFKELNLSDLALRANPNLQSAKLISLETGLYATFIRSLCQMYNLEQLYLEDMHIGGAIPSLRNLRDIYLHNVTVYNWCDLFDGFSLLTSLCDLQLTKCDLRISNTAVVFPSMPSLKRVLLQDIKMDAIHWRSCLKSLSMASNVHTLEIRESFNQNQTMNSYWSCLENQCLVRHCRLKDGDIQLPELTKITSLLINDMELASFRWQCFVGSFSNMSNLTNLELVRCYIADGDTIEFAEMPKLTSLVLDNVLMKEKSWSNLTLSIKNVRQLSNLYLTYCRSEGEIQRDNQYASYSNNKTPQSILIKNSMLGKAEIVLPDSNTIQELVLWSICLEKSGWAFLVSSINNLRALVCLEINECEVAIAEVDAQFLPETLSSVKLSSVIMSSKDWTSFFENLSDLSSVYSCKLMDCGTCKPGKRRASSTWFHSGSTRFFSISGCDFQRGTHLGVSDNWKVEEVSISETVMDLSTQKSLFTSLNYIETLRVVKISNGATGNIGDSVFDCEQITTLSLDIGKHCFHIGNLERVADSLEALCLTGCRYMNSPQEEIFPDLKKVTVLTIASPYFPPAKQTPFLLSISKFSSLTHLALKQMYITDNIVAVDNLKCLRWVSLDDITMPDISWSYLFDSLNKKENLLFAKIIRAKTSVGETQHFYTMELDTNYNVEGRLVIEDCHLNNTRFKLPDIKVKHTISIKQLTLKSCNWPTFISSLRASEIAITDCDLEDAHVELAINPSLKSVHLNNTRISGKSFISSLSIQPSLIDINVQGYNWNKRDDGGAKEYSFFDKGHQLSFIRCNLSKTELNEFPKYFRVRHMELVSVILLGSQWEELFCNLCYLFTLTDILIENCILDQCAPRFPNSCSIKTITLAKLTITSKTGWPHIISSCSNLTALQSFHIIECSQKRQLTEQYIDTLWRLYMNRLQSKTLYIIHSDFGDLEISLPVSQKIKKVHIKSATLSNTGWSCLMASIVNIRRLDTISIEGMPIMQNIVSSKPCISITALEILNTHLRQLREGRGGNPVDIVVIECIFEETAKLENVFKETDGLVLKKIIGSQTAIDNVMTNIAKCHAFSKLHIIDNSLEYSSKINSIDFCVVQYTGSDFDPPKFHPNAKNVYFSTIRLTTESKLNFMQKFLLRNPNINEFSIQMDGNCCDVIFPDNTSINKLTISFERPTPARIISTIHNINNLVTLVICGLWFTNDAVSSSMSECFNWQYFASEINKLVHLERLSLDNCRIPKQGSLEAICVSQLHELCLTDNRAEVYENVFELIGNMPQLVRLELYNLVFGEDYNVRIPSLPNLKDLSVVNCTVTDGRANSNVYTSLAHLTLLSHVESSGKFSECLSTGSKQLQSIQTVSLVATDFSVETKIQDALSNCCNISTIHIIKCRLNNCGFTCENLPNIRHVELVSVSMNSEEWIAMVSHLSNLPFLNRVVICKCITDNSQRIFVYGNQSELAEWQTVKNSNLEINADVDQLSNGGIVVIDSEFAGCEITLPLLTHVRRIALCKVSMFGKYWPSFIKSMENLASLENVSMVNCSCNQTSWLDMKKAKPNDAIGCFTIVNCDFGSSQISFPSVPNITLVVLKDILNIDTLEAFVNSIGNIQHLEKLHIKKVMFRKPPPKIPKIETLKTVVFDHVGFPCEFDLQDEMVSLNDRLLADKKTQVSNDCKCFSATYSTDNSY